MLKGVQKGFKISKILYRKYLLYNATYRLSYTYVDSLSPDKTNALTNFVNTPIAYTFSHNATFSIYTIVISQCIKGSYYHMRIV